MGFLYITNLCVVIFTHAQHEKYHSFYYIIIAELG